MLGKWKNKFAKIFIPPAKCIGKILPPNAITVLGFILGIFAALSYANVPIPYIGFLFMFTWAPIWFVVAVVMDALDGAAARYYSKTSPFGGVLDSTLDRYVDAFFIIAMVYGGKVSITWGFAAIVTSYMISYIRSRAEAAGAKMIGKGLMERAERLIIIFIATVIAAWGGFINIPTWIQDNILEWCAIIITVLGTITVIQRLHASWRELKNPALSSK
ncbi:MAG: CDP-alcohol phosphatidyltransferase family protein [Candidatus Korarchaeota archaeon]